MALIGGLVAFFTFTPQGKAITGPVFSPDGATSGQAGARVREYLISEVRLQVAYLIDTPTPTPPPPPPPRGPPITTVTPRPTAPLTGVAARPTGQSLTPVTGDPSSAATVLVLYYEAINERDLAGAVTFWAPSQEDLGRDVVQGSIQRGERFTVKDAVGKALPAVDAAEVTVRVDVTDSRGVAYRDVEYSYIMRYAESTWVILSRKQ